MTDADLPATCGFEEAVGNGENGALFRSGAEGV
jgi:hypothetical protein